MKNILDNTQQMQQLDRSNMIGSIELLGRQIRQTWDEVRVMQLPENYRKANKIVFSAMGGSALGAVVAKYLFGPLMKQPFEIVNDYHLPSYVDENTLVVVGSYSGTTEESISALKEAIDKKAKIICIATGNTLEQIALKNQLPFFRINPIFNPSNQPRMAIGYAIFAVITMFARLGIVAVEDGEIANIEQILAENNKRYGASVSESANAAKQLARKLVDRIPIFIAGEFLIGAVHAIRNQFNENAKVLAVYFPLPELDHHLLEALQFPKKTKRDDLYIFLASSLYSEKIGRRSAITNHVIAENGHETYVFKPTSPNKLAQTIESIHFGSYVGYYLALLYGVDPSPIEIVEAFKEKLAS